MSELAIVLAKLGDSNRPFKHRDLRGLSDLGFDQERELLALWQPIALARRRALVKAMRSLAEDSVEFDFRDVFSALLEDNDPEVRQVAVDGLWEDDRPRTLRRLLEMLSRDADSGVQAAAALGLGRFAYKAELGELRPDNVAQLRAALVKAAGAANLDLDVRRRAVESVGYFSGDDIIDLIKEAYSAGAQAMKESALAAIGHNLDTRWLPVVEAELRSRTAALRYEAARAAGEFGSEGGQLLSLLVQLTEDNDVEVATASVWALGQIGGPAAERTLDRILQNGDERLQQAAEDALAEVRFSEDSTRLI